ncbi:MAG: PorT family protein [Chitinophagaceae bacterium]|nr:PorT family protein [Chitinophagaceae bacterium]
MKKLISTLFSLLFFIAVIHAQEKILWGAKAGYNYSASAFTTTVDVKTKPVHGGYIGIMMKVPFDNRLFFAPQMDVSYRGMSTDSLQQNQFSNVTEFNLRVMPLLQFDFTNPSENANTVFVQFGPSIGFGLYGRQTKQNSTGTPLKRNLKYGFQDYGRYEANLHAGIGYETAGGFRVLLDYAHGLGNMINTDGGGALKYRTVSLGIGYWFGK